TAGVMTYYTCAPFWEETRMDAYFTPHRDLEDVFCKHGMPRDRLFPEGIPVSPECAVPIDTRAEKVAQGLPPDAKHVMIVGGSMGAGDLPDVLQQLAALPKEVYLTIICGNNESLRAQLAARFAGQARIRVCGYVSPLYTAMRSADVLVSKPGGLTTTEAMAQRIPMVLVNPIAGVETLNAAFFAARGLALYAKHVEEMLPLTRRLLYDADAMAKMRICQQKEIPCDASMRIARFLMQQVALRGKGREA
ncbi:MAG: glycosyltransferase, partial [Clostridia bacterium]